MNGIKFLCINLDRRPDRKRWIESIKQDISIEFRSAVDGKTLVMTEEIQRLFRNNDFHWRKSVTACALSHIGLWRELASITETTHYVIFEDDSDFIPDFLNRFQSCLNEILEKEYPLVFLGYLEYTRSKLESFDTTKASSLIPLNVKTTGGGLGGYMLSKKGAISLVEWIDTMGVSRAIDYEILSWAEHKKIDTVYFSPKLVRNQEADTDIQRDYTVLR